MADRKLEVLKMEGVEIRKTCCYFCHHNCGVLAYVKDGKLVYAEGDPNTANAGGLCARGNQAMTFLDAPTRINYPLKRAGKKGENKWERVSWDQALTEIAAKLNQIKEESGPWAVAGIAGTLRTDDWARRRFMNLYGTPNVCHNSLLCWVPTFMIETAVGGWSPFETDLGMSKCVILWGFNPGAANLPSAHGYFDLQTSNGMKIIVVDPRYTETAAHADLWLPLRPGSDTALALGMLNVIINERLYNARFVEDWCSGFDELSAHIQQYTPEWAAEKTWLTVDQIKEAARMYARNTPGNIQWGCTWDQLGPTSGAGTHARAIMRAICGNLDCPGGDGMPGPAAYITDYELEYNEELPEISKKKQLGADKYKMSTWPGYQRLADISKEKWGKAFTAEWMCEAHPPTIFKSVLTGIPYKTRAMFVSGSNPLSSYGDAKMVYEATKQVEFLVVLEYAMTPTALQADFVLPVAGAMERPVIHTNYGVTDSIVCHQRGVEPLYERKTDYNIWRDLGIACGQDVEKFWPNERLEDEFFDVLKPLRLPIKSYDDFVERFRMYYPPLQQQKHLKRGYFCTSTGKVELKTTVFEEFGLPGLPTYLDPAEHEDSDPELAKEYPLVLTTGGGFMPYCHSEHFNNPIIRYIKPDPFFTLHPDTAAKLNIKEGDWCWIETRRGRIKQRADVEPALDPRVIYTQRGWWFPERSHEGDQPFGCLESNTNVLTSVDDEHCDPLTGCWANRGLLCKVYKCTELDHEYTHEDTLFSIPGSAAEPGIDWEYAKNPPRALPYGKKIKAEPGYEVPPGLFWDYKSRKTWNPERTRFYDPEGGWMIDPDTNVYYLRGTNKSWFPASDGFDYLYNEDDGQWYDMADPSQLSAGPQPIYEVPEGLVWDAYNQYIYQPETGFIYDGESGWLSDGNPEGETFYDVYTGYAWYPDGDDNYLVDMETLQFYDFNDPSIPVDGPQPPCEVPAGCVWDAFNQQIYQPETGYNYDPESGWLVDDVTGLYYDVATGYGYVNADGKNYLMDTATITYYDFDDPTKKVRGPKAPESCAPGLIWDAFHGWAVDPKTYYRYDPATKFIIDDATNTYYDRKTGYAWFPDGNDNYLCDLETHKFYDYNDPTKKSRGPKPKGTVPPGLMWDPFAMIIIEPRTGRRYDSATKLLVDDETGTYYDHKTGYAFFPTDTENFFVDMETLQFYDYNDPTKKSRGPKPPAAVPPGLMWDAFAMQIIDPKTGYRYDSASKLVVDDATGNYYDYRYGYRWFAYGDQNFFLDERTETFYDYNDPTKKSRGPKYAGMVPPGLAWDPFKCIIYDKKTGYRYDPDSKFLIDDKNEKYYDRATGYVWFPYGDENYFVNEETYEFFDYNNPSVKVAGPQGGVIPGMTWNAYINGFIDQRTGLRFDQANNVLVNDKTGISYDRRSGYAVLTVDGTKYLFNEADGNFYSPRNPRKKMKAPKTPSATCPPGMKWSHLIGAPIDPKTGYRWDKSLGWFVDDKTGKYYDRNTLYMWDEDLNLLRDEATGKLYSMDDPTIEVNRFGYAVAGKEA